MVYYPNFKNIGIQEAISFGDGYSIQLTWNQAYLNNPNNKIAYHIYFSTDIDQVFSEGVKFVSFDGYTTAIIWELTPGQLYHFAVRAVEYDPTLINLSLLPNPFNDLYVYPESLLSSNISATDGYVPLLDTSIFPPEGIVKVGGELIEYLSINPSTNQLLVPTGSGNAAFIVDQGGGHFYEPSPSNVGDGYINFLMLGGGPYRTETWTIKCVFVENDLKGIDGYGPGYDGYARFIAIGSISGTIRTPIDGYGRGGDPYLWNTNNQVVNNTILSFSIQQGQKLFALGDTFTVKVNAGSSPYNIGRGFYNTTARMHDTDGYDGYLMWNPAVSYIAGKEETNTVIVPCQSHFEFTNYAYTVPDGYRQVTKDTLTTNLVASDQLNVTFNSYDYAGWHRTDPTLLLNGDCVGSYIGGQQYCADGYGGVGMQLRGLSFQERMNQREEILLTIDSEPMVLLQRQWTGITCNCYMASGEYPDDRCPNCFGTKFVIGWNQYFNPRISDGRIMVRVSPVDDVVKQYEAGLESEMTADAWTLVVPTIHHRDILVRFDQDGNEEFRYEVINVNRNRTLLSLSGGQHFRIQRIRKTDVAYQIPVFRNTQYFPQMGTTSVGFLAGIPHTHTFVISENFPNAAPQLTGVSQGHNHAITMVNGVLTVSETLGHSHTLIIPPLNPADSYVIRSP